MGRRQGPGAQAAGSSAPGVTSSSAVVPSGPTSAQSASGAAEARKLLWQYAKGARCADALQQLEALHRRSPSHMTCLALAKVRVRQAVDVALKQDGDEDAQEAALVPLLNQALGFAADGVTVHHSPNCLGLCDQLLAILCGRPGALGRKDALRQLAHFLPPKSSVKKEALAIHWVDTADELVAQDRWPIEAAEGTSAQTHVQRRLLPLVDRLRRNMDQEGLLAVREEMGGGHPVLVVSAGESTATPVPIRLFQAALLPDKLKEPLHRKAQQHQGSAEQERRRRRQQEEQTGEAERQRVQNRIQMERRKRQGGFQELKERADKVRGFLLRRMAAAAGEQQGALSGEQRAAQLEALLQQTEVEPRQLLELLSRTQLPQEQQGLVQRSLGLAETRQAVCYDLPRAGGEALGACATDSERKQLSSAALDAERFAAALHQLVWGNPGFARGQVPERLKELEQLALSAQPGPELGAERYWDLPEPHRLEVLPGCPGDAEVLLPAGAGGGLSAPALAAAAATASATLARLAAAGSDPSSPAGSPKAGQISGLDSVDDELPAAGGSHAAAAASAGQHQYTGALVASEDPGEPLLTLHKQLSAWHKALYNLDVLLSGGEEEPEVCCQLLAERLHEPRAMAQQLDLHMCRSLLTLELLRLLERRSAAGGAAHRDLSGQPLSEAELALHQRWDQLQDCWELKSADEVAEKLAENGEDAEQMKQLLGALRGQPRSTGQPLAPLVLGISVLQLQLCLGAAAARGGGQDVSLASYLAEARQCLARGVLAGLQALTSTRRLTGSLLSTVCQFVNDSLHGGSSSRVDAEPLMADSVLAQAGRLPLRRLVELHAFLALRMHVHVVAPKDLDPELQEVSLAACQQAVATPSGIIRLTESGLAAVGHDVALLEMLRGQGTVDEVDEPDMLDPAVAAEQLAAYCCGLSHAETELAVMSKGEEASTVEQKLEASQGFGVDSVVDMLQHVVYIRRLLAAARRRVDPAASKGADRLESLLHLLGRLEQLQGVNGGLLVDPAVRAQLSAQLAQLCSGLVELAEELYSTAAFIAPLERALAKTLAAFEATVLDKHSQQLKAEQRAGSKGAEEQLKRAKRELGSLGNRLQMMDIQDQILSQFGGNAKNSVRQKEMVAAAASKQLAGPVSMGAAGSNAYDKAAVLGSLVEDICRQLGQPMQPIRSALAIIGVLADVALEQGRSLEGHLLCAHCMQPSLGPLFMALSRHLLALKWQDDMAAEEAEKVAAEEAKRLALFEELMNEEENVQGKDEKAQEKRRAKKAAKKQRKAAAAEAAAEEAAAAKQGGVAPTRLESVEKRMEEKQQEGYRRMLEQMERDDEAAAEAQQAAQQQRAQQAQQAAQQQLAERPGSVGSDFDPDSLAGEDEVWGTPLSSPLPEGLEAPLEGVELAADAPAAPASPRPQDAAAAAAGASSAEAQPAVGPPAQQHSGSREQPQQVQAEQPQQQGAQEAWEAAGSKRRGKRGAAGKPAAAQQQAAAAPAGAPAAGRPTSASAAGAQAGQQAAPKAAAPAPAPQPPTQAAAAVGKPATPAAAMPPPEAEPAPASPPAAAAAAREDDGWEEAPVQRRRGGKQGAAAKPAAPAPGRPQSGSAEPAPDKQYQRIINWAGDWICECGQRNTARSHCYGCNMGESPCREYCFQGGCSRGGGPPLGNCKFPHPPFELPTARRPATRRGLYEWTGEQAELIAEGRREEGWGRPCMRPPPGVPLLAGQGAVQPAGGGVRRSATAPQPGGTAAGRSPAAAQGLLSPPRAGRHLANAAPPTGQPHGWGPAAAKAAAGTAAAVGSPRRRGPGQHSSGAWQAAPQRPTAAAAGARAPASAAVPPPAEEDEVADLLDMMGIGEANGTQAAEPAAAGWGEPSSWAQHVGGRELEAVEQAPGSWPAPGQDAEDAELEAAIRASLAETAATASRQQAGAWQELPPAQGAAGGRGSAAAGGPDSEALALAGLRNEAGEYNCFLNVVVQCLWRCAEFRHQVAGWDEGFRARDPVLAALHGLFAQLERQEAARSSAARGGGGGRLPPVDPAPLREALAALPGQGFSLGEMNDAAELLLCVYEKVMEAEGAGGRGAELAATFGLAVREEVHCSKCGKTTHQNAYTQYFYNTQATTLQLARLVAEGASMGALLRDAEAQHRKSCDTDVSGCGELNSVNHFLQAAPRVFTLQVAWETHAPDPGAVAGTLAALDEQVDLGEVYQGVDRGLHRYALRSMVCYYGQHYQALVLVPEAGGWLMFDDTRVSRVGTWADVRRKCEAGRIQPSVLFYEAVA